MSDGVALPLPPGGIPEECDGFVLAHWNKDFLCYCLHCGNGDPLQQIFADAKQWPGAPLTGFLMWYPAQWALYLDILEKHWRAWEPGYRQRYRAGHRQPFSDWLWARHAQSHVVAAGLLSKEEKT